MLTRKLTTAMRLAALAATLVAAGCGSVSSSSDGRGGSSGARATTPFQARMLDDGEITFAEYRRATDAVVRCLRRGPTPIKVTPPKPAPGGELEFTWSVRTRPGRLKPAYAKALRHAKLCSARFEDDVKLVYSNQRVIPPSRRPAVLADLVRCLRGTGLAVPDRPAMPKLIAVLDADRKGASTPCTNRYADFFRVPAS